MIRSKMSCDCEQDGVFIRRLDAQTVELRCPTCQETATVTYTFPEGLSLLAPLFCPCAGEPVPDGDAVPTPTRLLLVEMDQRNMGRDHYQDYVYQCQCPKGRMVKHQVFLQDMALHEYRPDPVVTPTTTITREVDAPVPKKKPLMSFAEVGERSRTEVTP